MFPYFCVFPSKKNLAICSESFYASKLGTFFQKKMSQSKRVEDNKDDTLIANCQPYIPAIGDVVHGMKIAKGTLGVDCFLGTYVVTDVCSVSSQVDGSEKATFVIVRFLSNGQPFGNPLAFFFDRFCASFKRINEK